MNTITVRVPEKIGRGISRDSGCTIDVLRDALIAAGFNGDARQKWYLDRGVRVAEIIESNDSIYNDAERRAYCVRALSAIPGVVVIDATHATNPEAPRD